MDMRNETYMPPHKEVPQTFTISSERYYFMVKRLMDIIGAICGLLIFALLFCLIAIIIKLESPKESVFFKQIRVGKDGKEFCMYKLRSMCSNAEEKLGGLLKYNEVEGPMFKMKDDPRVTRIGRFIRKHSIDEFPQLLNVLKGDMSLVGPRPPLPREVARYTAYDKQRLTVVPGCTGLWQVSGRNNLSFDQMVEFDINYIENVSFINDVKILCKTVGVVFRADDVY